MLLFISFSISCDDGLILFKKHTCQKSPQLFGALANYVYLCSE